MSSLEKWLQDRWALTDKNDDETKSNYEKYLNAELDQVSEYKDKKFKSTKLQEQAIAYINTLDEGKKSLKYFGSTKWSEDWYQIRDKRTSILVNIRFFIRFR